MTKVGVFGAGGKMGRTVCAAVAADAETQLVAAVDPAAEGEHICGVRVGGAPEALLEASAGVAVDFTRPDAVRENVRWCVDNGIHCVVGTTGLGDEDLAVLRAASEGSGTNVFVAPNFSIGAVLAAHFAKQAARFLGSCEVIELHHNEKLDAPSGTALKAAREIAAVWSEYGRPPGGEPAPGERETVRGSRGGDIGGVGIHSVRLRGLVAHQEILFGGQGELLTIRHDSIDRSSFMPGVLLAVKHVAQTRGLTVGLEHLLGI